MSGNRASSLNAVFFHRRRLFMSECRDNRNIGSFIASRAVPRFTAFLGASGLNICCKRIHKIMRNHDRCTRVLNNLLDKIFIGNFAAGQRKSAFRFARSKHLEFKASDGGIIRNSVFADKRKSRNSVFERGIADDHRPVKSFCNLRANILGGVKPDKEVARGDRSIFFGENIKHDFGRRNGNGFKRNFRVRNHRRNFFGVYRDRNGRTVVGFQRRIVQSRRNKIDLRLPVRVTDNRKRSIHSRHVRRSRRQRSVRNLNVAVGFIVYRKDGGICIF